MAVIGAGFGDEGKGRVVNDLLDGFSPDDTYVVRHNSSAQAGHTVVHEGERHVFSHFGSGTLRGFSTVLGPKFVINPGVFFEERNDLIRIMGAGNIPDVHCHPKCLITTPYDAAANKIREMLRGNGRHGSCGHGFGETIGRHEMAPSLSITYDDLYAGTALDADWLEARMADIQKFYLNSFTADELDIVSNSTPLKILKAEIDIFDILEEFDEATYHFSGFFESDNIIFEGAQGLMLDQGTGYFPHVTRCNTGIDDIMDMMDNIGRKSRLDVYYVTRPYMTRHGAGPLPHEVDEAPVDYFKDDTNLPNDWQGTLRFGFLDVDKTVLFINLDMEYHRIKIIPHVVMTCIDQIGGIDMPYFMDGILRSGPFHEVARLIAAGLKPKGDVHFALGPNEGWGLMSVPFNADGSLNWSAAETKGTQSFRP